MSYYYLIASLPMLKADGDRPLSYAEFLETCRATVGKGVFQALEALTIDSQEGPLVKEWAEFYDGLKRELAYQRKLRLGREAQPPALRDDETTAAVTSALSAKNPLESERSLLKFEFDRLERLTGMHYFDNYVLFGYALKLKLLERRDGFDKDAGVQEFHGIFQGVREQILSFQRENVQ